MGGKIADPSLAPVGEKSYEWAYRHMPTLTKLIEEFKAQKPLEERVLGVCLHVTKETSVLVKGLLELGGKVYLAAANPLSTQDEIAAYLAQEGVEVWAWRGESPEEYNDCIRQVLRSRPQIVMDDGGDAHITLHEDEEFREHRPLGGTEETTTGVVRLRALERAGKLKYPVVVVNNAYTKYLFDNRYGTGQSTFDGILRATALLIAGKRVVVAGYGWVGRGIAMRARGLGALTIVTEVDPFRALEARMDGFDVMPMDEAARIGDFFITATGQYHVIRREHIEAMKDGVILANAGHFDVEIDVEALREMAVTSREVRPHLREFTLKGGKRIYLIGEGRIANLVAAEGHPPEVMSLSFSNQLLSAVHIAKGKIGQEPRLLNVPEEIDRRVAATTLQVMGVRIDQPTEEQVKYRESWLV